MLLGPDFFLHVPFSLQHILIIFLLIDEMQAKQLEPKLNAQGEDNDEEYR